ncbi:CDP-alcohol phosphatidyltransferase family protein [Microlunatus sp. GCM10028923]|uniref:CDP-alcohol phosphatidyltransferase family protein n=1 Tax=Microlunatus sp. GCM10028923 TaxID=3273400 RepID=UPI00360D70F7
MAMEGSARSTFRSSLRRLSSAQKSGKGAPPYSLFVNRPVGRVFAASAYQLGLTPNQVTGLSAVFTFASIGVLALVPPVWWLGLPVGAGLIIGYALDSADGQLARLRGGGSPDGEWLDHMIDAVKVVAVHLVVLISWFRYSDRFVPEVPEPLLLVPIGSALVSSVHFFGMILVDLMGRLARAERGEAAPPPQAASLIKTLLKLPTDYGLLCLLFLFWGVPWVFPVGYTLMAVATAGYLLLVVIKWRSDVQAMKRVAP